MVGWGWGDNGDGEETLLEVGTTFLDLEIQQGLIRETVSGSGGLGFSGPR